MTLEQAKQKVAEREIQISGLKKQINEIEKEIDDTKELMFPMCPFIDFPKVKVTLKDGGEEMAYVSRVRIDPKGEFYYSFNKTLKDGSISQRRADFASYDVSKFERI